jgi:hemerythrin-like domain-containing protein
MTITDALRGEHGVLYAQFDYVLATLTHDHSLPTVQALAALLDAGLRSHAMLEDHLLFSQPACVTNDIGGVLRLMEREHTEIAEDLDRISAARDAQQAAGILRDVVFNAREHFAREENATFPLAEELLGDVALHQLGKVWAERRGVANVVGGIYGHPVIGH